MFFGFTSQLVVWRVQVSFMEPATSSSERRVQIVKSCRVFWVCTCARSAGDERREEEEHGRTSFRNGESRSGAVRTLVDG